MIEMTFLIYKIIIISLFNNLTFIKNINDFTILFYMNKYTLIVDILWAITTDVFPIKYSSNYF